MAELFGTQNQSESALPLHANKTSVWIAGAKVRLSPWPRVYTPLW